MEVADFWKKVDAIDLDSREDGRYTKAELFDIGCAFFDLDNTQKREIGGWDALTRLMRPIGNDGEVMKSGDAYRCWVRRRRIAEEIKLSDEHLISGEKVEDMTAAEFEDSIEETKRDLYKQQIKTRDVLNAYRRSLREEARLDDLKDTITGMVDKLNALPEISRDEVYHGACGNEAVLMFSDLHLGVEIDNFYNKYNLEIARKRVQKMVDDTIRYCHKNDVERLYVLGLGDFCAGYIHTNGRVEQQVDAASQIMYACEIVADVLNQLQAAAPEVVYCSCTDNHSRMVADLSSSIEAENFGRIITFYLKARLAGTSVIFKDDNLDPEIGLIEFKNGKTGVFAHGHHDGLNSMFQNMTAFTGRQVDYAFVGHYHCEKLKTFNNFKVFVNGSIVGVDQYAFSKRLFGKPTQTLLVMDGTNLIYHSLDLDIQ